MQDGVMVKKTPKQEGLQPHTSLQLPFAAQNYHGYQTDLASSSILTNPQQSPYSESLTALSQINTGTSQVIEHIKKNLHTTMYQINQTDNDFAVYKHVRQSPGKNFCFLAMMMNLLQIDISNINVFFTNSNTSQTLKQKLTEPIYNNLFKDVLSGNGIQPQTLQNLIAHLNTIQLLQKTQKHLIVIDFNRNQPKHIGHCYPVIEINGIYYNFDCSLNFSKIGDKNALNKFLQSSSNVKRRFIGADFLFT